MQHRFVRPRPSLVVPPHVAAERRAQAAKKVDPSVAEDEFVQTEMGLYTKSKWNGRNESGIEPWGERMLVMPDMPATRSKGGIEFTEDQKDTTGLAAETGVLVECADGAFTWTADRTRPFTGNKPTPGMRIYFERYAGSMFTGCDGKKYRLLDDRCLSGVERE